MQYVADAAPATTGIQRTLGDGDDDDDDDAENDELLKLDDALPSPPVSAGGGGKLAYDSDVLPLMNAPADGAEDGDDDDDEDDHGGGRALKIAPVVATAPGAIALPDNGDGGGGGGGEKAAVGVAFARQVGRADAQRVGLMTWRRRRQLAAHNERAKKACTIPYLRRTRFRRAQVGDAVRVRAPTSFV